MHSFLCAMKTEECQYFFVGELSKLKLVHHTNTISHGWPYVLSIAHQTNEMWAWRMKTSICVCVCSFIRLFVRSTECIYIAIAFSTRWLLLSFQFIWSWNANADISQIPITDMIGTALTHWRYSGAIVRFIHKTFIDNSSTKRNKFIRVIRLFRIDQVRDRKIINYRHCVP